MNNLTKKLFVIAVLSFAGAVYAKDVTVIGEQP